MTVRRPTLSTLLALAWVSALVAAPACSPRSRPEAGPVADYNTLAATEISQRQFYTAYDAVQTLRPNWLHAGGGADPVQVYVDDNHAGGLEVLQTIRISSIARMRHIDGIQAPARYGAGHTGGVILVTTRAAGR
jgi:hypothetical protein